MSRTSAYMLLLGMSTLSALAILSLWLLVPLSYTSGPGLPGVMFLVAAAMPTIQFLLVIPATLVVYRRFSSKDQLHLVPGLIKFGIPLIFNLLVGGSLFIYFAVADWQRTNSDAFLLGNLTLTIKEESLVTIQTKSEDPFLPLAYHAVLHAENNTGQRISGDLELGGRYSATKHFDIPPGNSDIIADLEISKHAPFCDNDILAYSIDLHYSFNGSTPYKHLEKSLLVDKQINLDLQELVCNKGS